MEPSSALTFSIVIPTHRRPQLLARCLEACAALRFPRERFEVIVVDDGGQLDASVLETARRHLNIMLTAQPRRGPAAARNAGARLATHEYLAYTDDDCRPDPDWLNRFADRLRPHPSAVLGGRTLNALRGNVYSETSQTLVHFLYEHYAGRTDGTRFFTSNNFVIRRDVFLALGGFNERFTQAAAEDRELCYRAARNGIPMVYSHDAVVHHWHDLSLGTFCRQHFRYGKGAARLRDVMRREFNHAFRIEPLRFYVGLLQAPRRFDFGPRAGVGIALCVVTQLAHAMGYVLESLRPGGAGPASGARVGATPLGVDAAVGPGTPGISSEPGRPK